MSKIMFLEECADSFSCNVYLEDNLAELSELIPSEIWPLIKEWHEKRSQYGDMFEWIDDDGSTHRIIPLGTIEYYERKYERVI